MYKTEQFLSVRDLSVEYSADGAVVKAVSGVSFDLEKGKTLGLIGETGAGKTTIAKAILRILPEPQATITSGEMLLEGEDLCSMPEKDMLKVRGKKISMIFQDPMTSLNPVMRVGKQIAEAILLHNDVTKQEAREHAGQMLEMVGIPAARYGEYPHQFSGGMKQRVVIAMALACNPDLLLADEPTTALDVTIQAQVLDMIGELKTKYNTSMILITHDLGIVAEACDKVAIVYSGEIVEYGSREDIFDHPTHPYTIGLFGAVPSLDTNDDRLTPINGAPPDPTNLPDGCHFYPRCSKRTDKCQAPGVPNMEVSPGHTCLCYHAKEDAICQRQL